jgi:NDP-sugar pyrophosphorylase family protein/aminoglycoside/choline kinase family phosphotransferase
MMVKSEMPASCFIPGAGLGTRLRPLTESLPKPLLLVGGRPLITYAMDHCLAAGVRRFLVNTHHLAAAYEAAFPDRSWRGAPIIFRYEPVLLDTAGGLKNMEDLLEEDESLLVYNGDILSDISLSRLIAAHRDEKTEATLALRSRGPNRNVSVDDQGRICDIRGILGNPGIKSCLFTGIYIVKRSFLSRLHKGRVESVIVPFVKMIKERPGSVGSVVIDEGLWEDIGDPEAYARIFDSVPALVYEEQTPKNHDGIIADLKTAAKGIPCPVEKSGFAGISAVGGVSQKGGAENHPDEEAFIRSTLDIDAYVPLEMRATGKGGSDRSYFRVVRAGYPSVILMRYGDMVEENAGYVFVASFLREVGVRVPVIHGHDPAQRLILMEDLGDIDLYGLREKPWEARRPLYEKTLEIAAKMHAFSRAQTPASLALMPGYDENLYKWERDYFRENLVRNVCRVHWEKQEEDKLEAELAGLAGRLMKTKAVLIHRDFQSQNVMIKEEKPALIDFQGLRPGCLFYDLGSLLYDPYVQFSEEERDSLLAFYYSITESPYPRDAFRELFWLASAQRLMQALGAYGFLGLRRGKPHFLQHIPRALANLVEVTRQVGVLPELEALARRCLDALDRAMPA